VGDLALMMGDVPNLPRQNTDAPGGRRRVPAWAFRSLRMVGNTLAAASYFRLDAAQAQAIPSDVVQAVKGWHALARGLSMRCTDLLDFEPAFVESTTP